MSGTPSDEKPEQAANRVDVALGEKIRLRQAVVGVIGLGYVGLPLARSCVEGGYGVIGFDVDPAKIEKIEAGENYLKHLGDDLMTALTADGRFGATTDFSRLAEADVILICVPTPLGVHREPDLSYVEATADVVAEHLRPGQLVVLESTTYPHTTREIVQPRLDAKGLRCGRDYLLAYSPEREDPGSKTHSTRTIPKLVGGVDAVSGDAAAAFYRTIVDEVYPVSGAEVAEAAKLLENIYRAVNIAMVNEMKMLFTEMDIDIWEVIDAAATKPFGFQAFYPGPGLGGHCIPIDPFYLTWKAHEVGMTTRFIELAGEINHAMPDYVVRRTGLALNERSKAIGGSRILILGLAYKPNVDDVRESPSFTLIHRFRQLGAHVDYHDPHVPHTHHVRKFGDLAMTSIDLHEASLSGYDAVVLATHHAAYDADWIARHAKLVIDTRGFLRTSHETGTIVSA